MSTGPRATGAASQQRGSDADRPANRAAAPAAAPTTTTGDTVPPVHWMGPPTSALRSALTPPAPPSTAVPPWPIELTAELWLRCRVSIPYALLRQPPPPPSKRKDSLSKAVRKQPGVSPKAVRPCTIGVRPNLMGLKPEHTDVYFFDHGTRPHGPHGVPVDRWRNTGGKLAVKSWPVIGADGTNDNLVLERRAGKVLQGAWRSRTTGVNPNDVRYHAYRVVRVGSEKSKTVTITGTLWHVNPSSPMLKDHRNTCLTAAPAGLDRVCVPASLAAASKDDVKGQILRQSAAPKDLEEKPICGSTIPPQILAQLRSSSFRGAAPAAEASPPPSDRSNRQQQQLNGIGRCLALPAVKCETAATGHGAPGPVLSFAMLPRQSGPGLDLELPGRKRRRDFGDTPGDTTRPKSAPCFSQAQADATRSSLISPPLLAASEDLLRLSLCA